MNEYSYEIEGEKFEVGIREYSGDYAIVEVNGKVYHVNVKSSDVPQSDAPALPNSAPRPSAPAAPKPARKQVAGSGTMTAPMPGTVLKILVNVGDSVKQGDKVMIIEAMKMENDIKASTAGKVEKIMVMAGDNVNTGDALVQIT